MLKTCCTAENYCMLLFDLGHGNTSAQAECHAALRVLHWITVIGLLSHYYALPI